MGKTKFQSVMEQRNNLLNLQAVWTELKEYLGKFMNTDAAPAKHGIRTKTAELVVPQDTISNVISHIEVEYLDSIQQQLDTIDRSDVHVTEDQSSEEQEGRKATREGRPSQAKGHSRAVRHPRPRGAAGASAAGAKGQPGDQ